MKNFWILTNLFFKLQSIFFHFLTLNYFLQKNIVTTVKPSSNLSLYTKIDTETPINNKLHKKIQSSNTFYSFDPQTNSIQKSDPTNVIPFHKIRTANSKHPLHFCCTCTRLFLKNETPLTHPHRKIPQKTESRQQKPVD